MAQQESISLEYIWIDAKNNLRSKMRTIGAEYLMNADIISIIKDNLNQDLSRILLGADLRWSYDGSSTGQASGHDSEVMIEPVYICPNEYKNARYGTKSKYYIAMCETIDKDCLALSNNHYSAIKNTIRKNEIEEYYFSFEQEFFIMNRNPFNITQMANVPIGMPLPTLVEEGIACNHQTTQQYYCSAGSENIVYNARELVERVYHWGIRSGLILSGYNAEVAIGQWEIQVGPSPNIRACHELWIVRYLLKTMAEEYGYCISYHPKPLENWNGSGLHTNFSNQKMRNNEIGYDIIIHLCEQLGMNHRETMQKYGEDNQMRMTGGYETASFNNYTYGVANRSCSIRIPRNVFTNQCGYIEDRRPASNADPYLIYNILTTATSSMEISNTPNSS